MSKSTASKLPASSARSPKAARQRRLQAARLFEQGLSQAEVARRLGVSRQTASRWHARWRTGGGKGLAGPGRWGRPSRLSDRDWQRVEHALLAGAVAQGFDTDLWTPATGRRGDLAADGGALPPGACVVAATPPRLEPATSRAARQRARRGHHRPLAGRGLAEDQRGALKQGAWICLADESGATLVPPVRRTWAPRGHTPILRHRMRGRKRVSMAGVCCYRPDATDARLAFHLREGAYDTAQLIGVVGALQGLLGGGWPVILVWDNLPAHTSLAMRAWAAQQCQWLQVEYLPAYAPDLDPVEGLWPT